MALSLAVPMLAFGQDTLGASKQAKEIQRELDSLTRLGSVSRLKDSLKITRWSDSLSSRINQTFSPTRVTRQLDSLKRKGASLTKLDFYSDSLARKKDALLGEVTAKQKSLHKSLSDRYNGWTSNIRKRFNLDSAGIRMPSAPSGLPAIGLPSADMPKMPGTDLPVIPALSTSDFASLPMSNDLKQVGGAYTIPSTDQLNAMDLSLPQYSNPLSEYQSKLGDLKGQLKDPGKAAEDRVSQIAEVQQLEKQAGAIKEMQSNEAMEAADQLKGAESPEALLPAAVDHFAGKEAVLQQSMDQMTKYKEKYTSLPDMSAVKKTWWPHNSLKGVPFKERFRVGLNLGVKNTRDTLFLDWHPNASYRISGRFEAGLGLMYRLRVHTSPFAFDQKNPVWGMSTFVVVKTFKSVFIRVETDGTSIPKTGGADNALYRDWRWSFLSGVQTNFRIATQWTGNVQMLYNFDSALKDKFPEQLVIRVGVQYKLD